MLRLLALLTLAFALIVPRAAWATHVSVDDTVRAATAMHVHHDGHSHDVDDSHHDDHDADGGQADHDAAPGHEHDGVPHNHVAADVLSAMATGGGPGLAVEGFHANAAHGLDTRSRGAPSTARNSLLRPPRTI